MRNLVLITSIIHTPNKPLSYTNTRSVFTSDRRFEDTKKTIISIKQKIPDCKIMIVECSPLTIEQHDYLTLESDYFLNLYQYDHLHPSIFGISKSLGEGTQTIHAIKYLKDNRIPFDNFFKISGRYWLNDSFDIAVYKNNPSKIIIKYIDGDINNGFTAFYKLPFIHVFRFQEFLETNTMAMQGCVGFEVLFAYFLKCCLKNDIEIIEKVGLTGYLSICNSYYEG